ncbi:MAG TPA: ROK family protein [Mycobacteriales bacterium]|nr:ROK family protein [Mycobacteriales bacterium]
MTDSGRALALDIGGTKIAAAWVGGDGSITARAEIPTVTESAERLWLAVRDLLVSRVVDEPPARIGVGCGGPLRLDTGEVSPINIGVWRDFPLLSRVRELFPDADVRLHNDAVAMAAGEAWRGAGRGIDHFLGVVVSTGVGGGLVIGGRIFDGPTGNAGHVGHIVVEPDGPPCGCGGFGCLEAIARGPAVVQRALDNGWTPGGQTADGRTLVAAARAGDEAAADSIDRAGRALGIAFASAASLLELDRIAVGGGFATGAGDLLFAPMRETFAGHAGMAYVERCEIVPAELAAEAGLVGAAALVLG